MYDFFNISVLIIEEEADDRVSRCKTSLSILRFDTKCPTDYRHCSKSCEICMLLFSLPWNSTYITGVFMWIVFVSAKRNDEIISNKAINLSGIKEHLDLEMGLERPTGWVYIHWMSRDLWHIFLPYTQRMHSSRIWPGLFTIYFLAVFPRCVQDQLQFGLSVRTVRIMWSKS